MRPQGRAATDSLYFNYPQFQAPARAQDPVVPVPVAIVGAGPVGMTAALTLARWGVPCVLLDNKSTFNDGSRAICLARQSFHIFESVGVVDAFLHQSLPYLSGRSFYRGQQILEFFMPDGPDHKYRPMYNLQQQYTEAFLYEAVAREPLIEVRWQSEVIEVAQDGATATLTVQDPEGSYPMCATWVLAADGARSVTRSRRGLRLKGQNFEGRYIIADIRMKRQPQGPHRPVVRLALFDPDCRRGGTVLVHEQPDHIWRIDYQVTADESEEEALEEDAIRSSIAGVLADLGWTEPWQLEWWSIYSANTLALDDYRDGRIFYIGDSAHIVPIFGVRGLNNGLADAQNIGWKLAMVLQGHAPEGLLDSYTPERRGATMDVFANASQSSRFMTPQTRGWALMRDAALSLALKHPFAGEFANPRNMTPYTYAESPIVMADASPWRTGPGVGAVAHNLRLDTGFLSDLWGYGFTLMCFGARPVPVEHPLLKVLRFDAQGPIAQAYGAAEGSAYLIRPDMHVAARWHSADVAQVQAGFRCAMGGAAEHIQDAVRVAA
ncbi:MAG: FAD-dependent monooxygenase [Alphaproteobacteria bacterium]|nr:FAD-dependent monooxygenase [Alphaproteobacteria bacterium]